MNSDVKRFADVRNVENTYYSERRKKAADEFHGLYGNSQNKHYEDLLRDEDEKRPPVGLAFSGGGIRSATFNLGILQGLSKFGILPWVDYLTSVSGGGFIASCMTSLLSYEEKNIKYKEGIGEQRYYPFNTLWDRFPFNPNLQVFNNLGVAYKEPLPEEEQDDTSSINIPLLPANEKDRNRQLEHMRNFGNYLIPRMGLLTLETMRGFGAFLMRTVYTLSIFLMAITVISATYYALAAAFTPELNANFLLDQESNSPSIVTLLFNQYDQVNSMIIDQPWQIYKTTFISGIVSSLLITLVVSFFYRKDPTTENRYRGWESPSNTVSVYSWLVIRGIKAVAIILLTSLTAYTIYAWLVRYQELLLSQTYFYLVVAGLFSMYFGAGLYFLFYYVTDEDWSEQGLPEQEWIDKLVVYLVVLVNAWVMTIVLAELKIHEGFDNKLRIYWVIMPAVFLFANGWGLILFQYLQLLQNIPILGKPLQWLISLFITKKVKFDGNVSYDENSINPLVREYLRWSQRSKNKRDTFDTSKARVSRGIDTTFIIWSNPDFRSIYWTIQGIFLYGILAFILLGLLVIPHYFIVAQESQANISLSLALITGIWSSFIAAGKPEESTAWFKKIFSLSPELRQALLAILVLVFNLSILFLMMTILDTMPKWEILMVAGIALILLYLLGLVNANYLSAHYFFRDRAADAYLRTELDDLETGRVMMLRDDRDRLMSRILQAQCSAPYHIVLATINLAGSWFLQFKDRKSQPFIISKDYCGSEVTGYVETKTYRKDQSKYSQAIALSGAAVSSGLGSITFFAQAFVTTLFNLRLGLWVNNPARYKSDEIDIPLEEKTHWLRFLWDEMRGRISERRELINLTDGAHTDDNIGLYPLFQRRCKFIIAGDAGEDPEGYCSSLMSVLRQVNIDFGVEVDINVEGLKPGEYNREEKSSTESKSHFAIGKITYPKTSEEDSMEGWLIYFRPSIVKGDPSSILKYWERHKLDFPHPSTADQFFDEEQFEVQRLLGEWTVESALKTIRKDLETKQSKVKRGKEKSLLQGYIKFVDKMVSFDGQEKQTKFIIPKKKKAMKGNYLEATLRFYHDSVSRADETVENTA